MIIMVVEITRNKNPNTNKAMAKIFFGLVSFPGCKYKMNKEGNKKAKMVEPVDPVSPKTNETSLTNMATHKAAKQTTIEKIILLIH